MNNNSKNNSLYIKYLSIFKQEPNDMKCATYVFNNQDHTLGNLLRVVLNGNADVEFAGYSIPHPS